jgi:glycosyltransferase involved in cell wall biosynthesis
MKSISQIMAVLRWKLDVAKFARNGWPRITLQGGSLRALLLYRSPSMEWRVGDSRFNMHENFRQSRELAELLQSMGFTVDVIDNADMHFEPTADYELFIGHPGANARRLMPLLSVRKKICLEPGQYGPEANRKIAARFEEMCERRNLEMEPELHTGNEAADYLCYDAIACFGNAVTAESYKSLTVPVYPFPNYPNQTILPERRYFSVARNKFLYMAAGHHVRKGLDLLLEAFASRPEAELFVCGKLPNWLLEAFKVELNACNIHCLGTVDLSSRKFKRIARQCAFYIAPTCAEGMQGGALNAMASGMIPVVHRQIGFDLPPSAVEIEENTVAGVQKGIDEAMAMLAEAVAEGSLRCVELTKETYSPAAFASAWESIVSRVMEKQGG